MADQCILCGTEDCGGNFSRIGGIILRPLCTPCYELCSKDSKRVIAEHRELFERILAERRESLASSTSAAPARSQRERTLVKRYDDAFLVANGTVAIGKTTKLIGAVLATLVIAGGLVSMTVLMTLNGDAAFAVLLVSVGVGGVVGMFGYALGTLIATLGQMLRASLDCAVNSSPFLNNELRAEIMSI